MKFRLLKVWVMEMIVLNQLPRSDGTIFVFECRRAGPGQLRVRLALQGPLRTTMPQASAFPKFLQTCWFYISPPEAFLTRF